MVAKNGAKVAKNGTSTLLHPSFDFFSNYKLRFLMSDVKKFQVPNISSKIYSNYWRFSRPYWNRRSLFIYLFIFSSES